MALNEVLALTHSSTLLINVDVERCCNGDEGSFVLLEKLVTRYKAVHSCISAHAEYVYDLKEPDLGLLKHLLASVALRLEAKFLAWPISSQI